MYLCDAVVAVDQELELVDTAPEHGAMLGHTYTEGRSLSEFVYHEDLKIFVDELKSSLKMFNTEGGPRQEAMQVRLMDIYGAPFSVHVFLADVGAQMCSTEKPVYLLGICEQW